MKNQTVFAIYLVVFDILLCLSGLTGFVWGSIIHVPVWMWFSVAQFLGGLLGLWNFGAGLGEEK